MSRHLNPSSPNRRASVRMSISFAAVVACTISVSCERSGSTVSPGPEMGANSAPYRSLGIVLPDLSGDDFEIVSETPDDLHVLVFWEVWCTPCHSELFEVDQMWREMRDRGLHAYGISVDGPDTVARVPGFVLSKGYEMPILLDSETQHLPVYNPGGGCPFYVVLDADGAVLDAHEGYVKGDMDRLRAFLVERMGPDA